MVETGIFPAFPVVVGPKYVSNDNAERPLIKTVVLNKNVYKIFKKISLPYCMEVCLGAERDGPVSHFQGPDFPEYYCFWQWQGHNMPV